MDVNGPNAHPLFKFLKGEHIPDEGCLDQNDDCNSWADVGECEKNPSFMAENCPVSCGACFPEYEFYGDVKWNFEFFLVDDAGQVLERWKTGTDMLSEDVIESVEFALELLHEDEEEDDFYEGDDEEDDGDDDDARSEL
mmetsp:Transcript_6387/g.17799  ORF Transcript_6387/g.17799 Transcript_6387/m.17799 type:complete len:139 (+) Transcript_6387:615-1031(+)